MQAALQVLSKFSRLAESHRVDKIVAVATSATREAENGGEFPGGHRQADRAFGRESFRAPRKRGSFTSRPPTASAPRARSRGHRHRRRQRRNHKGLGADDETSAAASSLA